MIAALNPPKLIGRERSRALDDRRKSIRPRRPPPELVSEPQFEKIVPNPARADDARIGELLERALAIPEPRRSVLTSAAMRIVDAFLEEAAALRRM